MDFNSFNPNNRHYSRLLTKTGSAGSKSQRKKLLKEIRLTVEYRRLKRPPKWE